MLTAVPKEALTLKNIYFVSATPTVSELQPYNWLECLLKYTSVMRHILKITYFGVSNYLNSYITTTSNIQVKFVEYLTQ